MKRGIINKLLMTLVGISKRTIAAISAAAVLLVVAVLAATCGLSGCGGGGTSSSLPPPIVANITWSTTSVESILSPGENGAQNVTFRSDQVLQNVTVEASGTIASVVTISPNSFANVPAGQDQAVKLTFLIPPGTALGTLNGTVQISSGPQVLSQALRISLNVWQNFSSALGGYSIKVPPELKAEPVASEPPIPDASFTLVDSSSFAGLVPDGIENYDVLVFDNPNELPVAAWLRQTGISPYPDSDTVENTVTIGGAPGIQMASQSASRTGYYISTRQKIYNIEWPNYDPADATGYQQFVSFANSFRLQ